MSYYHKFEKAVHRISRAFMYVAAAALLVMMVLTTCDVIGRYVFNSPIRGTQDLIEFGLVLIGFSGLGYLTSERHHMRADMLNSKLSSRQNAIVSAGCFGLSLPFVVMLAWQTCVEAFKVSTGTYVSQTISIPLGPFYLFAGFGLILLCVEIILDIVKYINEARGSRFAEGDAKGLGI